MPDTKRRPWWVAYPNPSERKLLAAAKKKVEKNGEKLNHTQLLVRLAQTVVKP
jgi:hypothetical protein